MKRYGFHGEKEAPEAGQAADEAGVRAFWNQIPSKSNVLFRINRGHPLVEALVQNLNDTAKADAFLHSFERLLPVAAIMQQPSRTTHGLIAEPDEKELNDLLYALRMVIEWFKQTGKSQEEAVQIALSTQPFIKFSEAISGKLSTHRI